MEDSQNSKSIALIGKADAKVAGARAKRSSTSSNEMPFGLFLNHSIASATATRSCSVSGSSSIGAFAIRSGDRIGHSFDAQLAIGRWAVGKVRRVGQLVPKMGTRYP
jgi:hypothetical protein